MLSRRAILQHEKTKSLSVFHQNDFAFKNQGDGILTISLIYVIKKND